MKVIAKPLVTNLVQLANLSPNGDMSFPWHADTTEPQFGVSGAQSLAGSWIRLEFAVRSSGVRQFRAGVAFDVDGSVEGAREREVILDDSGHIRLVCRVPSNVTAIRVNPIGDIWEFAIEHFSVQGQSEYRSFWSAFARDFSASPYGTFRKAAKVVLEARSGGWSVFRRRLRANLERNAAGFCFVPDDDEVMVAESSSAGLARGELERRTTRLLKFTAQLFERERANQGRGNAFVPKAAQAVGRADLAVKAIAFYLPQFHRIPENDRWWGKGFTEWTNVTNAVPQFIGHFQPQFPGDLGFYDLRVPEVMRQQVELARHYVLHGFCFHYCWFGGRRLLELPVQRFLADPDLGLNFCFCWVNENWTRRWDGNESEILLGQNYSSDDARSFIRYLIPFFRDARYIKVDGRPILFIYRVAWIPNVQEYLDIWQQECASAGIGRPYVVAVLRRGASDPRAFGMDAGVERRLHDGTSGAVPECRKSLRAYGAINGSVLPYGEVARIYADQGEAKEYTYFRSLVPTWDNIARYGTDAYLVHGSTPQGFEDWLRRCVAYAESNLPADRRFVLVNAWNEWAGGAHLEPDSRLGFGYPNAVGRALSDIPYGRDLNSELVIPAELTVFIDFPENVQTQLRADADLLRRFTACLERSTLFRR